MAKAPEKSEPTPAKYVVTLYPIDPVTVEANSPEEAKAKFNEICGIVRTVNEYKIEPVA